MLTFLRKIRLRILGLAPSDTVRNSLIETGSARKPTPPARPNGLLSGRVGRYLFYAVGEMLLVIMGILIALSLNNWNEDRKLKLEEQSILKDLKEEMSINLTKLKHCIERHEKSYESAKKLSSLFRNRAAFEEMPDSTFARLVLTMYSNWTYDPQYGMLNSIISSGRINLFSNKELKYALASIKEKTVDAFESVQVMDNEKHALYQSSLLSSNIIENGKIVGRNIRLRYDDPKFRILNDLYFNHVRGQGLREEYVLMKDYEHILELIDQSIKN